MYAHFNMYTRIEVIEPANFIVSLKLNYHDDATIL